MKILGIETTCDETGAAVVEDPSTHSTSSVQASSGLKILSNVVASSVELQRKYGGVVPEVAAREQVRVIIPVVQEALTQAFGPIRKRNSRKFAYPIDAIAVAHGPGLIGSLLIGVETAKSLALVWDKPLIAVNHLIGHIYANWLTVNSEPQFSLIALIVSGGHTDLVLMTGHTKFKLLGSTLDDATGEAFDKVARVLGLGYPGGPEIEDLAKSYQLSEASFKLPRPMINSKDFDFSFSGLKTAVVNRVMNRELSIKEKAEIAHEFQRAVVDVLVTKTINAAKKYRVKSIVVGGGVAASSELRRRISDAGKENNFKVFVPSKVMSVDNGAMIAAAAFYNFKKVEPLRISANPGLHF